MRRSLLAAAVMTVATATTTFAADAVVPPAPTATNATVTAQDSDSEDVVRGQSNSGDIVRGQSRRGGFFSRWMELERRKNAWLRRTFLNR